MAIFKYCLLFFVLKMVNEKIKVRDKYRRLKRFLMVFLILAVVVIVLVGVYFFGWFSGSGDKIVLENPLKNIVLANTNAQGQVDYDVVVSEGVMNFNADYINYIMAALGVGKLHKSIAGFGNPVIEMNLDGERWNAELDKGLKTELGFAEDPDLRISMTKEEAVKALLSPDVKIFMKDSVVSGNTQIEMIAGKVELGSKGYLSMYSELTGESGE